MLEIKHYIRKPYPVEAVQFTGEVDNAHEIVKWISQDGKRAMFLQKDKDEVYPRVPQIIFAGIGGQRTIAPGTWIIKVGDGQFIECLDGIFQNRYYLAE